MFTSFEAYTQKVECRSSELETLVNQIGKEGAVIRSKKLNDDKVKAVVKLHRHVITCSDKDRGKILEEKKLGGWRIIQCVQNEQDLHQVSIIYVKSLGDFDPTTNSVVFSIIKCMQSANYNDLLVAQKRGKISKIRRKGSLSKVMLKTRNSPSLSIGSPDEYQRQTEKTEQQGKDIRRLKKSSSFDSSSFFSKSMDGQKEIQVFNGLNIRLFCSSSIFRKFNSENEIEDVKDRLKVLYAVFNLNSQNSTKWKIFIQQTKSKFFEFIDSCQKLSETGLETYYSNEGSRSTNKTIYSVKDDFKLDVKHGISLLQTRNKIKSIGKWVEGHTDQIEKNDTPVLVKILIGTLESNIKSVIKEINLLLGT